MIMEDAPEFSKEVTFDSGRAQNYTEIKCETDTFPPAKVSWLLISDEYPCPSSSACGRDVARLESTGFSLLNSGSRENLSLSIGAIIEMLNLQYEEDGNFTCTADNGYASASRTFILRVKCELLICSSDSCSCYFSLSLLSPSLPPSLSPSPRHFSPPASTVASCGHYPSGHSGGTHNVPVLLCGEDRGREEVTRPQTRFLLLSR